MKFIKLLAVRGSEEDIAKNTSRLSVKKKILMSRFRPSDAYLAKDISFKSHICFDWTMDINYQGK